MDLYSIKTIKSLLKDKPSKRLGQNFLIEKRVASKLLRAADVSSNDTILEVGPGIGTLTRELAKAAGKVVAVEKDGAMVEVLKKTLQGLDNVEVIHQDILSLTPLVRLRDDSFSLTKGYKVVANLPYYITSPVIRMFLEATSQPELLVLMVQKELAQRITAKPPEMSILGVAVQFYAKAALVASVHKRAFWPQPKVDSAIIKITPRMEAPGRARSDLAQCMRSVRGPTSHNVPPSRFFRVVKAGFVQPRKQLLNNLSQQLRLPRKTVEAWLSQAGIDPKQRAETLSLKDWIALAKSLP